jgi:hypothetical protein
MESAESRKLQEAIDVIDGGTVQVTGDVSHVGILARLATAWDVPVQEDGAVLRVAYGMAHALDVWTDYIWRHGVRPDTVCLPFRYRSPAGIIEWARLIEAGGSGVLYTALEAERWLGQRGMRLPPGGMVKALQRREAASKTRRVQLLCPLPAASDPYYWRQGDLQDWVDWRAQPQRGETR